MDLLKEKVNTERPNIPPVKLLKSASDLSGEDFEKQALADEQDKINTKQKSVKILSDKLGKFIVSFLK